MKLFRTQFAITIFMFCIAVLADNKDLAGYTRLDRKPDTGKEITLAEPDFEKNGAGWRLMPNTAIEKGTGRSATHALKYERTDPKSYHIVSTKVKLKPGEFYRFGAWIKTADVTTSPQGGGATIALEFSKTGADGKGVFLTGRYLKGITGTNDWTLVADTVRIPPDTTNTTVSLYLWQGSTGTAWFDDIIIQEQGKNLWTAYLLNPYNTVSDGKCTVAVSHDGKSVAGKPLAVRMHIKEASLVRRTELKDNRAEFALGELPPGSYNAEFMILDTAKKAILHSSTIPLKIAPEANPAVSIDRLGRTLVNGRPFMPVGIFTANLDGGTIDMLLKAGLNCILPYGSMNMRLSKDAPASPEQVVKVMDLAAAKGLKVIFSCKDVGSTARYGLNEWHGAKGQDEIIARIAALLKGHPALLAWYINDEQPSSQIERVTAMRQLFNKLDPDHPTYGVLYQYEDLPLYGPTSDIIGVDPYPLTTDNMKKAVYAMQQTALTGLPAWTVPQASNTAIYRADKQITEPNNPTEEGMRSLVILEAAYGAKGFIFYKLEDLWSWKLPKGNFAGEWPKVKNTAAMLKTLEPYIMSEYPVELLLEGGVVAARLRNGDGKSVILICSIGPGPVTEKLNLDGNYTSQYGRTRKEGNSWVFTGQDISSDLLFEE